MVVVVKERPSTRAVSGIEGFVTPPPRLLPLSRLCMFLSAYSKVQKAMRLRHSRTLHRVSSGCRQDPRRMIHAPLPFRKRTPVLSGTAQYLRDNTSSAGQCKPFGTMQALQDNTTSAGHRNRWQQH